MKKLILIMLLVSVVSTFTNANVLTKMKSTNSISFVTNQSYTLDELVATNVLIKETNGIDLKTVKVKNLPYGYITDSSGATIGYWVYDPSSGVLLIVIY